MKKAVTLMLAVVMALSVLSINAFAAAPSNEYEYVGTYTFALDCGAAYGLEPASDDTTASSPTMTVTVYNDRGKNIYRMETTAHTAEEEAVAFEMFDQFVENGSVQESTVTVNEFNKEFFGSDVGRGGSSGTTGYDAYNYSWARYVAGEVVKGGKDSSWGKQTARWMKTNTSADYIKLHQSAKINVRNADASLTISWPPALTVSSNSASASVASWSSEVEYDTKSLAADHETVEYNWEDLQYGGVTSFIYTDSADIKYGSSIYKPSSTIRFENGF